MSSFINLCQSAHQKLRGGNATPGQEPSAIPVPTNPRKDQMVYDVVDAVQLAWSNLQNKHPVWNWMRKQCTVTLAAHARTMSLAVLKAQTPDLDRLIPLDAGGPLYANLYDAAAPVRSDSPCYYIDYENWRGYVDRRPINIEGRPSRFTIWPDLTLEVDPTPNVTPNGGNWAMSLDYRVINQSLVNGGDVPAMPDRFHELLVWMAVRQVCETRNSTGYLIQLANREIYGSGREDGRLNQLEIDQLPPLLIDVGFSGYR